MSWWTMVLSLYVGGGWHASTFWHYASGNLTGQNFCGDVRMVLSLATDIGVHSLYHLTNKNDV